MASLTIARQRNGERRPEPQPAPGGEPSTEGMNLDAIRTAGL
jgi:hypothetical protein